MGVAQSEISRIEKRHDMLLSTLTNYLSAAGEHPRVVVTVNGQDVELDLTTLSGAL
jgi:intracellular sulfur oxidation DsrE/DsrF family protein